MRPTMSKWTGDVVTLIVYDPRNEVAAGFPKREDWSYGQKAGHSNCV